MIVEGEGPPDYVLFGDNKFALVPIDQSNTSKTHLRAFQVNWENPSSEDIALELGKQIL